MAPPPPVGGDDADCGLASAGAESQNAPVAFPGRCVQLLTQHLDVLRVSVPKEEDEAIATWSF